MVSGTRRYKNHSWVTVTPCEKVQSTTDLKPVNETEAKHSKWGFLLVNRETQCDPMLADSFQLAAGSTTSARGFSGISRFSVTSEGSWYRQQKSYRLFGSFRVTTGGWQRRAPSRIRGWEPQTKALGIWRGAESWRTGLTTHFGEVHATHSSRAQEAPSRSIPGGWGAAHRSPAWLPAAAAHQRDSLQFNQFSTSSRPPYSLHPLNSLES